MATFLQLAQRLRQEAGVSGTGPSSVVSQTGEMLRIVDWVRMAWTDIQMARQDWDWLREDFSFSTVSDQRSYTPAEAGIASRFGRWNLNAVGISTGPQSDETLLAPMSYASFRSTFMIGPQTTGRPIVVTSMPDQSLGLGYTPNAVFTVRGEYWKSLQTLSADGDTPEAPAQFHDAILYRALMLYARYESAAEIYSDADMNYRRWMGLLQDHQTPMAEMPGTLA